MKVRKGNPIVKMSWNLERYVEKGRRPTVHIYYIGSMIPGILYIERDTFWLAFGHVYSEQGMDALILL